MVTACKLMLPRACHKASSLGRNAAGSFGTASPSNSLSWLAKMMTAIPAVKPTVTGKGMYFT